jgi:hypothetical protein
LTDFGGQYRSPNYLAIAKFSCSSARRACSSSSAISLGVFSFTLDVFELSCWEEVLDGESLSLSDLLLVDDILNNIQKYLSKE